MSVWFRLGYEKDLDVIMTNKDTSILPAIYLRAAFIETVGTIEGVVMMRLMVMSSLGCKLMMKLEI